LSYFLNVAASLSHVFNAFTGGDPRNSFSARVGKAASEGVRWAIGAERVINSLMFDEDHCAEQARFEGLI